MKRKQSHNKIVSVALSILTVMTLLTPGYHVSAEDRLQEPDNLQTHIVPNQWYQLNETLQPYGTCLSISELKEWSPDNDPDARYNRGAIPLKKRWMGPSVNGLASRDAKVMPLVTSNARASEGPSQGSDGSWAYVFNNFQYIDTYNFWGGSVDEGPVAIPSPEHIDSAHRNGCYATGTIFLPWGNETFGAAFVKEMTTKNADGSFPYADKLIEIAAYYGFDGYIINAESGTGYFTRDAFREFLIYIQKTAPENFRMSWYNGTTTLMPSDIENWMQNGDTRINDVWWLDMGGSRASHASTVENMFKANRLPWDVHFTWYPANMEATSGGDAYKTKLDKNGKLVTSLGLYSTTETLSNAKNIDEFLNVREQYLWVGPSLDPSTQERPNKIFCGFSSLIADRTPIIGTDFVTHFNPGNGYHFYENGVVTGKENGWYNRSLTEILPTWRWMIEAEENAKKLAAKIDYEDAWWGGASLKVSGGLDAGKQNHIKLYSTYLDITDDSAFQLTYKTNSTDVALSVGLCYGDTYDEKNFTFYPVNITGSGEWKTASIDLSRDAGKKAIAISLKYLSANGVSDYTMNVGKLGIVSDTSTVGKPTDLTIDEVIYPTDTTAELRFFWDTADHAFTYVLHRIKGDGSKEFVGATPNNAFYVSPYTKDGSETEATFSVTAYGENGIQGGTETIKIPWPAAVENGFEHISAPGKNLALGIPVTSDVTSAGDGPVSNINDGVIPSSKWCAVVGSGAAYLDLGKNMEISRWIAYHANCRGAGEGKGFNTQRFSLAYAPDDGAPKLDVKDAASDSSIRSLNYTTADNVSYNSDDVTDRNLAKPITARYIKLQVDAPGGAPWTAIRIYELELYEKPGSIPVTVPATPLERSVTVHNNVGDQDTVVIDDIGLSSGTVNLYSSADAQTAFASVNAKRTSTINYKYLTSAAEFKNLSLDSNGGRIWYAIQVSSGKNLVTSPKRSVAYPPESGSPIAETTGTVQVSVKGINLTGKDYGVLQVSGLQKGATVSLYPANNAQQTMMLSYPAGDDGTVRLQQIPLNRQGGTLYYRVRESGKPDSEYRTAVYGPTADIPATPDSLEELCNHYEKWYSQDAHIASTWKDFGDALSAAKTLLKDKKDTATAAEVAAVRTSLKQAEGKLLQNASLQRLKELCDEIDVVGKSANASDFAQAAETVKKTRDFIQQAEKNGTQYAREELEKIQLDVNKALYRLPPRELINEIVFPDPALLAEIKKQTKMIYMDELVNYSGELNLLNADIHFFDGLNRLSALKTLRVARKDLVALDTNWLPKNLTTLDLSGCTELTTINKNVLKALPYLSTLDIRNCTKIKVLYLNNCNLEKLSASEPGAYKDIFAIDFSGNRFDLSENSPEGIFVNGLAESINKLPPQPIQSELMNLAAEKSVTAIMAPGTHNEPSAVTDGKTDSASGKIEMNIDNYAVIDMGAPTKIEELHVYFSSDSTNTPQYKWEYSLDGIAYQEIAIKNVAASATTSEVILPTPIEGRYFRFTVLKAPAVSPNVWLAEVELLGRTSISPSAAYGQQRPEAYPKADAETVVLQNSKSLETPALLSAFYDEAVTVRETKFADILKASWLADGHGITIPDEVTGIVTDPDGNKADQSLNPASTGAYTVEFHKAGDLLGNMTVKVIADKAPLNKLIADCKALNPEDYTTSSWSSLTALISSAEAAAAEEFISQKDVNAAATKLQWQKDNMEKPFSAKPLKDWSNSIWDLYKDKEENYTPASWSAFKDAVNAALQLAEEQPESATEEAYNNAKDRLNSALKALENQNKTMLSKMLNIAKELLAEAEQGRYFSESVKNLKTVISDAEAVMTNTAATQTAIDETVKKLQDAMAQMLENSSSRNLALLAGLTEALSETDYTPSSWTPFNNALTTAKTLLAQPEASQEDCDTAYENLLKSVAGLQLKSDKTELNRAILLAEDVMKNKERYTPSSIGKLSEIIAQAKEIYTQGDATQDVVDKTAKQLEQAISDLKEEGSKTKEPDTKKPVIPQLNTATNFAYINGYTNGLVKPNANITRAEVAMLFYNLLTEESKEAFKTTSHSYTDVKDNHWAREAIATLSNAKILKGSNGKFRPNDKMSRAELVTVISRFFEVNKENLPESPFSDTKHWAEEAIRFASSKGWINGYPGGTFKPNNSITRAETIKTINAVLGRNPEDISKIKDMKTFKDNMDAKKWYYKDIQVATNSYN